MKRIFSTLFVLILLVSPLTGVKAAENNEESDLQTVLVIDPRSGEEETIIADSVIILPDGSKIIKTAVENMTLTRAMGQKTGSSQWIKTGSDGTLLWRIKLTAHFTFDGNASKCTSASATTEVFQGNWIVGSKNTYPNGNAAVANVTMVRKFLFLVLDSQSVSLTIRCDKNGNMY